MGTLGLEVDDRGEAVVHNDHNKVGRAGGEGFVPPLSGWDPQDGGHDEGVGEQDEEEAAHRAVIHTRPTPRATTCMWPPQAIFNRGGTWQKKWWVSLGPEKVRWKMDVVTTIP